MSARQRPLRRGVTVRVRGGDPTGHHRVPRYLRGCTGQIVDVQGAWPVPNRVLEHGDHNAEAVFLVSFAAADVFAQGEHHLYADVWESDLEQRDV